MCPEASSHRDSPLNSNAPAIIPIDRRLNHRASTSRGFLPWRLSDAGPPGNTHHARWAGDRNPSQQRACRASMSESALCPRQSGDTSTRLEPQAARTKRFTLAMFGKGVSGARPIALKLTGVDLKQIGCGTSPTRRRRHGIDGDRRWWAGAKGHGAIRRSDPTEGKAGSMVAMW